MDKLALADEKLFLWINGLAGRWVLLDQAIRFLVSDYLVPVSMSLALVALWFAGKDPETRQRYQVGMIAALAAMALSSLAVFTINAFYFRPRPFDALDATLLFYQPTDSSFPANAAAAAFGMAAAAWGVNRKLGTWMLIGAGIYGFGRVLAGVHYPLDVLAGAAIGIVVAFLVFRIRDLMGPIPAWVIKAGRILCLA